MSVSLSHQKYLNFCGKTTLLLNFCKQPKQKPELSNNGWKFSEFSRIILDFSKWQQKKFNPSWRMKSSSLLQIAKKVCVFGVVGYTFQDNFAQPWLLSESSMEPTYSDGDMVLMSSWNYSIKRGDVILLKAPLITKEAICKRVVGMCM